MTHELNNNLSGEKDKYDILNMLSSKYKNTKQLITLGDKGSIYCFKNEKIFIESEKVKAIDTTGAGDTYIGYFISSISKKRSVKESMLLASSAAAIATTKIGAATSIPVID